MDTKLYDATITDALQLLRVQAYEVRKVEAILRDLEKALRAKLSEGTLTEFGATGVRRILADVDRTIDDYHRRMQGELDLGEVAAIAAERAKRGLELVVALTVQLPLDPVLKALAQEALILGAPATDWWAKQSEDLRFRFKAEVRQGIAAAETNDKIVARVFGQPRKGIPGIMDVTRRNAEALVRTSVQSVANSARQATFEANADIVRGVRWVTALDGRVCLRCAALADREWDLDGKPIGGHGFSLTRPPIHYNDRCVLVPLLKDIGLPPIPASPRASADGPQPAGTTFDDYLKRKGPAFQDEVLGKGRADLWRRGKITLADLINGAGRPLPLARLRDL